MTYGITLINRLQLWSQPLWLTLLLLPYAFVIAKNPGALADWTTFAGREGEAGAFNLLSFSAACTVALALVTQVGEQVDYLRFLPEKTAQNRRRWWAALLMAGPGWIVPGALKMLAGAFLAFLAMRAIAFVPAGRPSVVASGSPQPSRSWAGASATYTRTLQSLVGLVSSSCSRSFAALSSRMIPTPDLSRVMSRSL